MKHRFLLLCISLLTPCFSAVSQTNDKSRIPLELNDMSAFRPQAGNWKIVGDVTMDPNVDIHEKSIEAPSPKGKKNATLPAAPRQAVITKSGTGILLNENADSQKDNLVTAFEHGDIDLELELMLPKGSNSGIYLQGRYEIQLLDSWGVTSPKFSDIGGIFRNWESDPAKVYRGKAPLSNPSKAPGLWQKMKIVFRAPRFDDGGRKISNARFVSVELNGVKIHDNVEVPLPTGGPLENNEKEMAPLMIQGDHGPVAFRNIKYRLPKEIQVSLSNLEYQVFKGSFSSLDQLLVSKPVRSAKTSELSIQAVDADNDYGIIYKGNVTVPADDIYEFQLAFTGGVKLVVNGEEAVNVDRGDAGGRRSKSIALKSGTYPFEIHNFKYAGWMPPRLGLFVNTASSEVVALNAYDSYPQDEDPVSEIHVAVGNTTKLLRAFLDFQGDRKKRVTHSLGVGDPKGLNYVYDLGTGNLLCVWRGDFVNATPMWHDRGDGSFIPQGAVQYLFLNQPMAFLSSDKDAFPVSAEENKLTTKGYTIEEGTGRPVFRYIYEGLEVEDRVFPGEDNKTMHHELKIKNRGIRPGLYYKLAEGTTIEQTSDGSFLINDKQFYLKTSSPVIIRESGAVKELIVKVDGDTVRYSLIW